MKTNRVYIVCPFSQMEAFIRENIDTDAYFITGMAGRLCFGDEINTQVILYFIQRENIKEIIIVNDVNCRFMEEVLNNRITKPNPATIIYRKLISDFKEVFPKIKTSEERRHLLAKLNINDHFREIKSNAVLRPLFIKNSIKLRGMVTNRLSNFKEPINFM
ncbi:MAG: hypothetical protein R6W78_08205 [Bacteroidales bacterium]